METIFVAVDGSPASLKALRWALTLASGPDSRFVLATVIEDELDRVPAELADDVRGGCRRRVEEWADAAGLGPGHYSVALLEGRPGPALVAAIGQRGADLVVMGTEGTHGRFGPRLGSVTQHVAHRCDAPLVVVPVDAPERGLTAIVVGVDGSAAADAAVRWTAGLAGQAGAKVRATFVHRPMAEWVVRADPKSWYRKAVADLEAWTAALDEAPVDLSRRVCDEGHPALALQAEVDSTGADLLVVGIQPTGGRTGLRVGGTAFGCLQRATVPVALIPPLPEVR